MDPDLENVIRQALADAEAAGKDYLGQTGEAAARHVAMRADALLEGGDMEGHRVWFNIRDAIEEMQRARPKRDEATH